ncbi:hypothetical protein ACFSTJ_02375 [Ottowia pentelensis]|uniref:hypothetical protein n=1 Tax=Ottowia pentelensis TaxID=511108 RepID=UPI00363C893A
MKHPSLKLAAIGLALATLGMTPAEAACSTTVGAVMSLTGSLGVLGQQIAKGSELAISDLNAARSGNTCELKLSLLDDQTSPRWAWTRPRSWWTCSRCRPSSARCPAASVPPS